MASLNRTRRMSSEDREDQYVGFVPPEGPLSPDQSYRTLGHSRSMTRQKVSDLARIKFVLDSINQDNPMEFRRPTQDVQTYYVSPAEKKR